VQAPLSPASLRSADWRCTIRRAKRARALLPPDSRDPARAHHPEVKNNQDIQVNQTLSRVFTSIVAQDHVAGRVSTCHGRDHLCSGAKTRVFIAIGRVLGQSEQARHPCSETTRGTCFVASSWCPVVQSKCYSLDPSGAPHRPTSFSKPKQHHHSSCRCIHR
jgi:hypothetical protein